MEILREAPTMIRIMIIAMICGLVGIWMLGGGNDTV